LAIAAEAKLGV